MPGLLLLAQCGEQLLRILAREHRRKIGSLRISAASASSARFASSVRLSTPERKGAKRSPRPRSLSRSQRAASASAPRGNSGGGFP